MSAEILGTLLETSIATSAAALLVMCLRRPLRAWLGAGAAYLSWALVPMAGLAVLLPAPRVANVPTGTDAAVPLFARMASPEQAAYLPLPALAFAAWLLGACTMALLLVRQQRRFARSLGQARLRGDGLREAPVTAGLPAVVGVIRPRILLPADFDARYTPAERELILSHERIHIRRQDLRANAFAAALRVLYWFNPLLHFAVARFRRDQELACDERVLARHPGQRRSYAETMLKTHMAGSPLPVGCHWQDTSPLKERIAMLKEHEPRPLRTLLGTTLLASMCIAGGYAAWAAQPGEPVADRPASVSPPDSSGNPYPAEAAKEGIGGMVRVTVDVAADGSITGVRVKSSDPPGVFDAAALEMAKQHKFKPAIENGRPVARSYTLPFRFSPGGEEKSDKAN